MTIAHLTRRTGLALGLALAVLGPGASAAQPPAGPDLRALVPERAGPFRRAALPGAAKRAVAEDENLVVEYVAGVDTVALGVRTARSAPDAREEAIGSGADGRRAAAALRRAPTHFRTDYVLAWARGPYRFCADANSRAALDRFMRAFRE